MSNNREILFNDFLNISDEFLIDSYISKEKFYNFGSLNSSDKKLFKNYVRQVKWCYRFHNSNINIQPYFDDKKRYGEVEVCNIILKDENISKSANEDKFFNEDKKIDKIVEIVLRLITFPQILVVQYRSMIRIFTSHITVNLVDSKKRTLDKIVSTNNWIDTKNINDLEYTLFNNIQIENLNHENFYEFYNSFIDNVIKYNASLMVGEEVELPVDELKEINDRIEILNKEIKSLRIDLKNATQPRDESRINNDIRIRRIEIRNLQKKLEE
ncbi:DUF4391 domain-containing protein [Methanobrevibacter sp.]|uniref:DUF4391 domain-containing protein n=1 Tax=Methanobrevibacter sp. TaxID=66852 RepID=UPI003864029F